MALIYQGTEEECKAVVEKLTEVMGSRHGGAKLVAIPLCAAPYVVEADDGWCARQPKSAAVIREAAAHFAAEHKARR